MAIEFLIFVYNSTEHENKLNDMITELSNTLTTIKHDQEYMEVRDRIHRASTSSSNTDIKILGLFGFKK
jgi:hypothetical protein